jgi:hypothetical protein
MGFGGGGGGALPTHVHNSVPLQGGPLDFANDTIASLNAGSTTFSDGAALQELLIGTPSQALVVNGAGTAPEWATAAAGATVNIVEDKLTATFSSTGTTPTDITGWLITKPTITGGKCMSSAFCSYETSNTSNPVIYAMYDSTDGYIASCTDTSDNSGDYYTFAGISAVNDANGATIQMRGWSPAGTWEIVFRQYAGIKESQAVLVCMGVG